jgi:hypothetical protein
MREISAEQLKEILSKHELWLDWIKEGRIGLNSGEKADLQGVVFYIYCPSKINLLQICPLQIRPSQIRPSQIHPLQICPLQIRPSQIRPSYLSMSFG